MLTKSMKKDINMVLMAFITIESISLLYIYSTREYLSDFFGVKSSDSFMLEFIVYLCTVFLLVAFAHMMLCIRKIKVPTITIRATKNGPIDFLIITFALLYFWQISFSDIGRVSIMEEQELNYTRLQTIIIYINAIVRFNFLFYVYASVKSEKDKGILYWIAVSLLLITELLRGVSFPIFLLLIIEMDKIKKISGYIYLLLLPIGVYVINFIYEVKFSLRYLTSISYTYFETTAMAIGRFSTLSNSSFFIDKFESVHDYIMSYSDETDIYSDFFSRLTPFPSIFGVDSDFTNYGTIYFSYLHDKFSSSNALVYPLQITVYNVEDVIVSLIIVPISIVLILLISKVIDRSGKLFRFSIVYLLFFIMQSFYGLLASYLYVLITSLFLLMICNVTMSRCNA